MRAQRVLPFVLIAAFAACGDDDPTEPNLDRDDVAGLYAITNMSFDPQGSLPAVDIDSRFGTQFPGQMNVLTTGNVQVIAQNAANEQVVTVNGTYATTPTGIDVTFGENSGYRDLLLSRRMEFTFNATAGTLSFSGDVTDISRARLIALVPELEDEQLLDPTPGQLTLTLTRNAASP
jgi:hypothetical protein